MSNHVKGMTSCRPPESEILNEKSNESQMDLINRWDAINEIAERADACNSVIGMGQRWTALRDALMVLEQIPSANLQSTCNQLATDCISRNAIIKKLNTMDRYKANELVLCDTDKTFPRNEVFIVDDVYEEIVEQLPSAHPDLPEWARKVEEYRKSAPDTIYNPLAWALYQTWKEYDR